MLQYRKRYELLQLKITPEGKALFTELQYRKRYELLQLYRRDLTVCAIALQYRKRYELLQHS